MEREETGAELHEGGGKADSTATAGEQGSDSASWSSAI